MAMHMGGTDEFLTEEEKLEYYQLIGQDVDEPAVPQGGSAGSSFYAYFDFFSHMNPPEGSQVPAAYLHHSFVPCQLVFVAHVTFVVHVLPCTIFYAARV
jgi:hypothetical protein